MLDIKNIKLNYRSIMFSAIYAVLFSTTTFWGISLDNFGTIWIKYNRFAIFILLFITFAGFYLFLKYLPKIENYLNSIKPNPTLNKLFFENTSKSFWVTFFFITLCHIPAILAYFPGIFTYDALFQIQFFVDPEHIEVHPILHSLMIYGSYLLYKITHSSVFAMFSYTLIQQCIINLIFSYCVITIAKYTNSILIRVFALLFYAIYPLNCIFPLIATKDVLFSGVVLLFIIISLKLFKIKNISLCGSIELQYMIVLLLSLLLRHNGVYAYIMVLPLFAVYLITKNKQQWLKTILLLIIPLIIFSGINVIKSFAGIKPPPTASSIGIPLQQMGRVRILRANELSNNDKILFRQFVSERNEFAYNPIFADSMKENNSDPSVVQYSYYLQNTINNNSREFKDLYLKWFKLYPHDYIDAFLVTNHHIWSIVSTPSDILKYTGRTSNVYIMTRPFFTYLYGMPVTIQSLNKNYRVYYDNHLSYYGFEKNPITFAMYSIAFNTWVIIVGMFILLYRKKYNLVIVLSINLALLLTVLFGPISLLRYVYQDFLIIPLLLAFCFSKREG